MPEDVNQRIENIYERPKKIDKTDKHSKEDGETLERLYNRLNLDERRRKMLDDLKENNHVSGDLNNR